MTDLNLIYNSRQTLLDYLEASDYDVSSYRGFSINEVNDYQKNNQMDMIVSKQSGQEEQRSKIYIHYSLDKKISAKTVDTLIEELFATSLNVQTDILYIIIRGNPNDRIKNKCVELWGDKRIFVMVQALERLQFNVLSHVLVPKHTIVSEDKTKQIMKRYNIRELREFPEISRFDPVSLAIFIKPDQVCEIARPSKIAITGMYYRVCVNQ